MPRLVLLALALLIHASVLAQTFPTKPIRLIVPFAPGGSSEIVARSVAQEMSKSLGQTVFVDNKPGGAGTIAMQEVKSAAPDGYTLILGHVGVLAVNPYAMAKHPYDVNKDFAPIVLLARGPATTCDTARKSGTARSCLAPSPATSTAWRSWGWHW